MTKGGNMSIKNNLMNAANKVLTPLRNDINKKTLEATYKAQKEYGFKIGTGEHATWNNEADAFKHTYMQWYMTWHYGEYAAKQAGDYHEDEVRETIPGETNMDKWNNQIGRELAKDMLNKRSKDDWSLLGDEYLEDHVAKIIVDKMRQGELITHPSDPRKFENIDKERINPQNRVFTEYEIKKMGKNVPQYVMDKCMEDYFDGKGMPSTKNLDKRVSNNELIYVDSYTKADGTEVSGYYKRK